VATPTLRFRISPCKDKRYLNTSDCASSELRQYFPFRNETAQWQIFFWGGGGGGGENLKAEKEKKRDNSRNGSSKTIPFTKMHRKREGNKAIIISKFLQAIYTYLYRKTE
jgi:hypothetical protein